MKRRTSIALALAAAAGFSLAQSVPQGEISGTAFVHTEASLSAAVGNAAVVLPASATGAGVFTGTWGTVPAQLRGPVPVVLFLHGSSGLGLEAIGKWQQWLAAQGIASVAPDSFALPQRVTYKSPISRADYENIHALRSSEIGPMLAALRAAPWVDKSRIVLAGTSEGAVPVARWTGDEFAARLIYAWSCEDNYFVQAHRSALPAREPVLNVISTVDPFFSQANPWLGNPGASGHCANALKGDARSAVVLVPGAPHTLLNLPAARHATAGFLREVLQP